MSPLWLALSTGWALDLSYEDALRRAVERNPDLVLAGLDREAAEGALLASQSAFEPYLTAGSTYASDTSEGAREFGQVSSEYRGLSWEAALTQAAATGTTLQLSTDGSRSSFRYHLLDGGFDVSEDGQYQTSVVGSITQSLLQGVTTAYNLDATRAARAARDVVEANLQARRQQTLAEAANAYWSAYTARRLAQLATQAVEVAKEEQRVVHAKVQAGELAPVERARVDATVVQAETTKLDATVAAAAADDALLLVLGEGPGQALTLSTSPVDAPPLELDEASLVATAMAKNPALVAARVQEDSAAESLRTARQGLLPELSATASYGLRGFETSLGASTQEMFSGALPQWSLGGTLALPLFNRVDRGTLDERAAAAEQARISREALERATDQQVRAQARALEAAHQRVALADANLRLADETLVAERALQSTGRAIQKDVLEALKATDDARVQAEKARSDYQIALIELERLKGTL